MTPAVARILRRVVSSACGMVVSFGRAHNSDEAQAQVTELDQLRLAKALRELCLATGGASPERLHPLTALGGELGVHRAAVVGNINSLDEAIALQVVDPAGHGPGVDLAPASRKYLPAVGAVQVAVGVRLEAGRIRIRFKSGVPHIYMPHYPITQQREQAGIIERR